LTPWRISSWSSATRNFMMSPRVGPAGSLLPLRRSDDAAATQSSAGAAAEGALHDARLPCAFSAARCIVPDAARRRLPRSPRPAQGGPLQPLPELARRADRVRLAARPCTRPLPLSCRRLCFRWHGGAVIATASVVGSGYCCRPLQRLQSHPDRACCEGWSRAPSLRSAPRGPVSDRRGSGAARRGDMCRRDLLRRRAGLDHFEERRCGATV